MMRKAISLCLTVCFTLSLVINPTSNVQAAPLNLPQPGTMVALSPVFKPAMIKGLTVNKDNPFLFNFIVDVGQDNLQGQQLKQEGEKLIKYFLAALAVPENDMWVNLSPYEKDKTVPEALGQTDMGRDLLAQDYLLKQITASLIYPEKELGKKFWDNVYTKAQLQYGNVQIPVNTFNKVWILADKASVFERNQTAFVTEVRLKVMLEEDYSAMDKNTSSRGPKGRGDLFSSDKKIASSSLTPRNDSINEIIRQIVLPEIEREVNEGKNFAPLRQIVNSLVLANWYKKNLKESVLGQAYANKNQVNGLEYLSLRGAETTKQSFKERPKNDVEFIYQQYLKAYKKGVFNYIKEEHVSLRGVQATKQSQQEQERLARKYFSGGFTQGKGFVSPAMASITQFYTSLNGASKLVDFAMQTDVLNEEPSVEEIAETAKRKTQNYSTDPNRFPTLTGLVMWLLAMDQFQHSGGITFTITKAWLAKWQEMMSREGFIREGDDRFVTRIGAGLKGEDYVVHNKKGFYQWLIKNAAMTTEANNYVITFVAGIHNFINGLYNKLNSGFFLTDEDFNELEQYAAKAYEMFTPDLDQDTRQALIVIGEEILSFFNRNDAMIATPEVVVTEVAQKHNLNEDQSNFVLAYAKTAVTKDPVQIGDYRRESINELVKKGLDQRVAEGILLWVTPRAQQALEYRKEFGFENLRGLLLELRALVEKEAVQARKTDKDVVKLYIKPMDGMDRYQPLSAIKEDDPNRDTKILRWKLNKLLVAYPRTIRRIASERFDQGIQIDDYPLFMSILNTLIDNEDARNNDRLPPTNAAMTVDLIRASMVTWPDNLNLYGIITRLAQTIKDVSLPDVDIKAIIRALYILMDRNLWINSQGFATLSEGKRVSFMRLFSNKKEVLLSDETNTASSFQVLIQEIRKTMEDSYARSVWSASLSEFNFNIEASSILLDNLAASLAKVKDNDYVYIKFDAKNEEPGELRTGQELNNKVINNNSFNRFLLGFEGYFVKRETTKEQVALTPFNARRLMAFLETFRNDLRQLRLALKIVSNDAAMRANPVIDMAKFEINPEWKDQLAPYIGEGKLITPKGQELMAYLTKKYAQRRLLRLAERDRKQDAVDAGKEQYDFLPENTVIRDAYGGHLTVKEIRNSKWKLDPVPEDLTRPGAILTGPWVTIKWAINALRSGAVRLFWDREDAGWDKDIEGIKAQQVASDIINDRIKGVHMENGKPYTVPPKKQWPIITNRVRGLHFESKFFSYDGVPTSGMTEDLVTYIDNNHKALRKMGSGGIYIVLPKLETPKEIADAVEQAMDIEKAYNLPRGTIRFILMVETIELTLQLEEALWAGRHHIAITNVGRWDKMATDVRIKREDGKAYIPDPDKMNMKSEHNQAYVRRVTDITLRRGGEIEGGMFALMMSRNHEYPEVDKKVLEMVIDDKTFERDEYNMKYAWAATPQVVDAINKIFKAGNYEKRKFKPYSYSAEDRRILLQLPELKGTVTDESVGRSIYYQIAYAIGQRTGGGAVAIMLPHMGKGWRAMQDYAIFKIFYYFTWFLNRHNKKLDDQDIHVNPEYIAKKIDEAIEKIKQMPEVPQYTDADWHAVKEVIYRLNTTPKMVKWESIVMNSVIDINDIQQIDQTLDRVFAETANSPVYKMKANAAMNAGVESIPEINQFTVGNAKDIIAQILQGIKGKENEGEVRFNIRLDLPNASHEEKAAWLVNFLGSNTFSDFEPEDADIYVQQGNDEGAEIKINFNDTDSNQQFKAWLGKRQEAIASYGYIYGDAYLLKNMPASYALEILPESMMKSNAAMASGNRPAIFVDDVPKKKETVVDIISRKGTPDNSRPAIFVDTSNYLKNNKIDIISRPSKNGNNAMAVNGGIDLKAIATDVRKQGAGVQMKVDQAMIDNIRRNGIKILKPRILRMTPMPVSSIWTLVGLTPPKRADERLAGV